MTDRESSWATQSGPFLQFILLLHSTTDNRVSERAAGSSWGMNAIKGVPVGQGVCCQIKSQYSSGPAGEIRASSAMHAGRFIAHIGKAVLQKPGESEAAA